MSDLKQNHIDQNLPTSDLDCPAGPACCRWTKLVTPVLMMTTVVAISLAAYFAGRSTTDREQLAAGDWRNFPAINATATATGEKFSIATGLISEDAEGVFVLDHNSGLLQCSVIYPNLGQFMAHFTGNVAETLGASGKGGSYMMVTGVTDFPSASNRPAGKCILYVMDQKTGNYAAYGIPFDRTMVNNRRPQKGVMVLLYQGSANPLIDRDQLR